MIAPLVFWLSLLFIFYAYAGYPLAIALLAALRPARIRDTGDFLPSVTLLIAACDEEAVMAAKLENALSLDYPPSLLQILVAADGSQDRTREIVEGFASRSVELSYSPARAGKMAAINRAMVQARGEVVVFSDANNMYNAEALRRLAGPFQDPSVGAVSGAKSIVLDGRSLSASEGLYWKYESFIKERESRFGCCVSVAGEILAIRRSLFRAPPDTVINDDFFMAMSIVRRGYRILYAPAARSVEYVSSTSRDEIERRARIIGGRYQALFLSHRLLSLRHPVRAWQVVSHKYSRPLVPFAMAGVLAANTFAVLRPPAAEAGGSALFRLAPPFNWIFLALQVLFYLAALAGTSAAPKGKWGRLFYLPAFLVNSNLAAVLGLARFITGRQSAVWKKVNRREGG